MRSILLPLAALVLLAGCEDISPQVEAAAKISPVKANETALADERRVLDLEGGVNFRDLGGYRTKDGRITKWESVYRSGSPARLTAADKAELSRRGVRTYCDLRDNAERAGEPHPFADGDPAVTYWMRDYEQSMGDLGDLLTGPNAGSEASRAALIAAYRTIPEAQSEAFAQMFRYLARGQLPLAFNCSAGKDRTGVGAALLLSVLGVPRETIVADYALSDDIVDYRVQLQESVASNSSYAFLLELPWETVEPLLASDPAYIESTLSALEEEYGSVDAFVEQRLGVTPKMKRAIMESVTEPI